MMAEIMEDLAFRARKILKRQQEAGTVIDREAIAKIVELDAPIFSLTTGQTITPEQIEAATRLLLTIFVTEQGPALVLRNAEGARPAQWYVGDRRKPGPSCSATWRSCRKPAGPRNPSRSLRKARPKSWNRWRTRND
jgi:hypothetical protein